MARRARSSASTAAALGGGTDCSTAGGGPSDRSEVAQPPGIARTTRTNDHGHVRVDITPPFGGFVESYDGGDDLAERDRASRQRFAPPRRRFRTRPLRMRRE